VRRIADRHRAADQAAALGRPLACGDPLPVGVPVTSNWFRTALMRQAPASRHVSYACNGRSTNWTTYSAMDEADVVLADVVTMAPDTVR